MPWDNVWSFFVGFIVANLVNFGEFAMLIKLSRDIRKLLHRVNQNLHEFKDEGDPSSWRK